MSQKEVIIIISGAKYLNSKIPLIKHIILLFYKFTRIARPVYKNYAKDYGQKISKVGRKIVYLDWDRGFTIWSVWRAEKLLSSEINKYLKEGYKINIVGISLGGDIALHIINELKDGDIDKVVLISSINIDKTMDKNITKFLNIYSSDDLLAEVGTRFMAPVHGGDMLEGNSVKNINVDGFSHNQFCSDNIIKNGEYKGKRISELVKDFLS